MKVFKDALFFFCALVLLCGARYQREREKVFMCGRTSKRNKASRRKKKKREGLLLYVLKRAVREGKKKKND